MTITFIEAYALYGRDSAAIAEACGIDESEAYNLMAARADRDLGIMPDAERRERHREANRRWYEKNKAINAELRREARG
jgi:hypothetical protein